MLFVGDFEDIRSRRGIAWRCQDSLSLRAFLRFAPTCFLERKKGATPDHSSLSKIGNRLPFEVYEEVFWFALKRVHEHRLLSGKTVGVDSTFIEAKIGSLDKPILDRQSLAGKTPFFQQAANAGRGTPLSSGSPNLRLRGPDVCRFGRRCGSWMRSVLRVRAYEPERPGRGRR